LVTSVTLATTEPLAVLRADEKYCHTRRPEKAKIG
jgi:hypothetical protein